MPEVSVLLPAKNAAATLRTAIDSIRVQTFTDWELIIVDDGSTDGTDTIAAEAAHADARIRFLPRPPRGLVAALNTGLAAADGALIARMDADDEAMPARLERQAELLRRRPDIGVCSCLVDFGGDRSRSGGYALHVDWINSLVTPEEIALNRFVESPLAHPSVLFRRELVERLGGYAAGDFPEDYELWLRWLAAGVRIAKVPETLLRWNDPPGRLSRTDLRYGPDAFFQLKAKWIARHLSQSRIVAPNGRDIWVWGAGRHTRMRAAYLADHAVVIRGYVDIDPRKTGNRVAGIPVIAPSDLPPPGSVFVLGYVTSRGARELTRGTLGARAYVEGRDFMMCA